MGFTWVNFFPSDWILRTRKILAQIKNDKGEVIFEQRDVEIPESWSDRAGNIVANQYFRGKLNRTRETSFVQVVDRVVGKLAEWAKRDEYFDGDNSLQAWCNDLKYIFYNQLASFNSPVWYNLGVSGEKQLGSACFIGDVEDDMESISDRQTIEARVFKSGSGFGANNSKLRGSNELLSNGGLASGPVSFMLILDANAEVVRSAGKRRAAKMELLDADHPDIFKFVTCKGDNEEMAKVITKTLGLTSINQANVPHQNANHSVVVNNDFMHKCLKDGDWCLIARNDYYGPLLAHRMTDDKKATILERIKARDLLYKIAEQAHKCGDPGLFYLDNVNAWNTVPSWGKIVSCNPCAEFVQPPWSACNLASINLRKFFSTDSKNNSWLFDADTFRHVVWSLIIAMDLIAGNGDYPDPRIAENSKKYRPLGLGYTNLGAILVEMGLPYDSDDARKLAATVTSYMTAVAWEASADIMNAASCTVEIPKEEVLRVVHRHVLHTNEISGHVVSGLDLGKVRSQWTYAINAISKYGVRNSQVTLLAPTGTISFMMDAETTGIEPLVMLGGVKKMSDTGIIKFTLPKCVLNYIESYFGVEAGVFRDTGDGNLEFTLQADEIRALHDNHVLDTAIGGMGMGTINYMGHIKMMAAVQPFLSGAISKTVNLPNSVTVEEIYNLYIEAWKLGLKSIAVYRDGSKFEQPLNLTTKTKDLTPELKIKENGLRLKLPDERASITHKFRIGDHKGYLTTGFYPDGRPGEIFILMNKQGSTVRGLLDSVAILVSVCLQYGVPLEDLISKFKGVKFEPQGMTSNSEILFAQSPIDYIFRYLEKKFVEPNEDMPIEGEQSFTQLEDTGDPCAQCGMIMKRRGSCMYCDNCDITTGCS